MLALLGAVGQARLISLVTGDTQLVWKLKGFKGTWRARVKPRHGQDASLSEGKVTNIARLAKNDVL